VGIGAVKHGSRPVVVIQLLPGSVQSAQGNPAHLTDRGQCQPVRDLLDA
jgi:hypothetical protein